MTTAITYTFWALVIAAALQDLAKLKISNLFPLALMVLFGGWVFAVGPSLSLWQNALAFAIALGVGFGLFALQWLGGGDAKLFAAIALWFDLGSAAKMLGWVALMGGLLALMLIIIRRILPASFRDHPNWPVTKSNGPIPYGIAIAGGAIVASINVGFHPAAKSALDLILSMPVH